MVSERLKSFAVLAMLSLLYFLLMAGTFNSLGLVLPAMVEAFGMSWAQAGFGFTLLGIACGIMSLGPALLIRRIGVTGTLLLGTALLVTGFLAMYLAQSTTSYYVGTTLLGLGFCFCGTVPGVHVLSSLFARRSAVLGVYFTVGSLGSVAGPLFYWAATDLGLDWRGYWLSFAFGSLVIGVLAALSTRVSPGTTSSASDGMEAPDLPTAIHGWLVRPALSTVQFWVIVFAYTACLAINTTTHSFSYQHLLENGLSAEKVTQLISLSALIGAGGAALAGWMGEIFSPRSLTMLSLGCLAISAITLGIGQGEIVLGIWVLTLGVGLGFSYVGTAMLLQEYFGQRASLELYSIMTAISTSAAIGPAFGGYMRDMSGSFAGTFYVLAAIALALLGAVLVLRPPAQTTEPALKPAHQA
ncbi:MFS transporter [Novosphingobium aquimarinum]|uniref:MFS transporter n=1 Tax=Novosphingobium aquimarinum TaxID=2682494 RepID=UPI0012EC6331|nr:MFS transporter [Novosphingobium aquimarinum]